MTIGDLLRKQADDVFGAALGLVALVDDGALDWKPSSGGNWMTTGQLLKHLESACGIVAECFVDGDWSRLAAMEAEMDTSKRDPVTGMYPAEALPTASSAAATRTAILEDKARTLAAIEAAGEERLANQMGAAPWNPEPRALGYNLLECLLHVGIHRAQLFYYLKLQGKPVHTGHMWGMEGGTGA